MNTSDLLKTYIFSLAASGAFKGLKSPIEISKKALTIFARDLPTVVGEIAEMVAAQGGNRITAAMIGKANDIVKDIGNRGLKTVWGEVQEQYKRGMEINTRGRKR